ncbi:WG repeat-containing protein [Mucilaginibacter sp. 22184]|uniref:WG repeat-containing protein n=1 Tax=Mucilaginibacter sp. 22184 TaxID=3453887 RepID=UPI003F82DA39
MKTKPVIIVVAAVVILVCGFLFIRSKYLSKPEKGEITQFLNAFNAQIKAGNIDSASLYFEADQKSGRLVKTLLKVLTNKTNTGGKETPIFKVSLNTEDATVKFVNPELATANITANFNHDALKAEKATLVFTIHKTGSHQYKISQVNATNFVKGYIAFQNKVINKTIPEKDIYDPITLAAFKTADQLKTKYDTVLWFEHINGKTYFYVSKSPLEKETYWGADNKDGKVPTHQMALLNPELKEIIPPEYDLIHNIGGTVDGLIEVEKGSKRGFFDLTGKLVVPVDYDQLYPLSDEENLALLKKQDDYFYLKKDLTVSEKLTDFKIADVLSKIKLYGSSVKLSDKSSKNLMEYNSRERTSSILIPPSYLTDWQITSKLIDFQNPLRKGVKSMDEGDGEGSLSLAITFGGTKQPGDNWFESAFYSIADDYLGGRSGLYTTKEVLLVDKKQNRILGFNASTYMGDGEGGGALSGPCNENTLRAINDSLFEFKTTSQLYQPLLDTTETLDEGPYYHYLQIKDGKLVPAFQKGDRIFPTQYVKLDDSYLQNCYVLSHYTNNQSTSRTVDHVTPAILQLMKNEIYASYQYKFKNQRWNDVFMNKFNRYEKGNLANVDDSLTVIDKYNISFINSKLNAQKGNTLAAK